MIAQPTSIVLCDDHSLVREGLKQILNTNPNYKIIDDVHDGDELYKSLKKRVPRILLLDISLPGKSGLELLKHLNMLYPKMKVLALSMYPEDQFGIRMLKAGADGYLHKDSSPKELMKAIDSINEGDTYVSDGFRNLIIYEFKSRKDRPMHESLSDREYEVMLLIGSGKSMTAIADMLGLSIKTISTYKTRILQKLHIPNTALLIQYMVENGLMNS